MCSVAWPDAERWPRAIGRQRIDRAALDAGARDHGFAAHRVPTERQRDALQRLAFEAIAEDVGPRDGEAAIGRHERRDRHALRGKRSPPTRRPIRAAASSRRRAPARSRRASTARVSIRRLKRKTPVASQPVQRCRNANCTPDRIEPPQPRPQQRRRLEGLRKHPAAGADEGRLPQRVAPGAQRVGRKCLDRGCEMRRRLAVARRETAAAPRCA